MSSSSATASTSLGRPVSVLAGALEFLREFQHPLQGSESLVDGQSEIAVDERDVDIALVALDHVIH